MAATADRGQTEPGETAGSAGLKGSGVAGRAKAVGATVMVGSGERLQVARAVVAQQALAEKAEAAVGRQHRSSK